MGVTFRRATAVIVMISALIGTTACSSSSSKKSAISPLRVEMIPAAIAALEKQLGGPQQYFEINATPTLVNLFVATDNATKAVAYVYAGALQSPAAPTTAHGNTFVAGAISFDKDHVLAKVVKQLPTSQFETFAITGAPTGPPRYLVTVRSAQGGELDISVLGNGDIVAAEDP